MIRFYFRIYLVSKFLKCTIVNYEFCTMSSHLIMVVTRFKKYFTTCNVLTDSIHLIFSP